MDFYEDKSGLKECITKHITYDEKSLKSSDISILGELDAIKQTPPHAIVHVPVLRQWHVTQLLSFVAVYPICF